MKIELTTTVKATPQAVLEYLTSPQYIQDLNDSPKNTEAGLLSVTEVGRTTNDDLVTDQIIRYKATTRLPKFLKKYENRAPKTVSWHENYAWNRSRLKSTFTIVPDAPPHWQERYTTNGQITLTAQAETTQITHELEYKINLFGLATIIERALSSEIETIFQARNELIRTHFA